MSLIERLEQAARDCDCVVRDALFRGSYDQTAADYRDMMLEAVEALKYPPMLLSPEIAGRLNIDLRPGFIS